jgi:hypothetical protein
MSKDPWNPSVDLHIIQLFREGTVGTIWRWVYLHGHLSLVERLNPTDEKGPRSVALRVAIGERPQAGVVACKGLS